MSAKPSCFGYVNDNDEWLKEHGIKRAHDCKTCDLLTDCVGAYNQRVYNHWSYDHECDSPDPDYGFLDPEIDDGGWDDDPDDEEVEA